MPLPTKLVNRLRIGATHHNNPSLPPTYLTFLSAFTPQWTGGWGGGSCEWMRMNTSGLCFGTQSWKEIKSFIFTFPNQDVQLTPSQLPIPLNVETDTLTEVFSQWKISKPFSLVFSTGKLPWQIHLQKPALKICHVLHCRRTFIIKNRINVHNS